ncbi:hypothetical protein PV327_009018 [Microctonus hyperodae]|uniref:Large ribosomal subunit protein uL16m n=1 Tax=Microctonus hyperodae TaxID=165561 RepID=A0AA39KVG3_MICHY|nr:hypothetical protein PV327_009018 [Microctonus hyperodae]
MNLLKFNTIRPLLSVEKLATMSQIAGLQTFKPPQKLEIERPEKPKLNIQPKVPQYPASMRPFKMQKKIRLMRGPEQVHTEFIHKQYGIVAKIGGRMKHEHFEVIRMTLLRRCDFNKMFAIWRVDAPWQPATKKSLGQRMGGGKGAIDHYFTPLKAGRVIVEVGGDIEYFEVKKILQNLANKMPFKAQAYCYDELIKEREDKKRMEESNQNPWTWKYIIQNNLGGCHKWISPYDQRWYNEYL